MTWLSSLEYYKLINKLVQKGLGGQHSAKIILISHDFAEIATLQQDSRWDISKICPIGVIEMDISRAKAAPSVVSGREAACLVCGHCEAGCPQGAISLTANLEGETFASVVNRNICTKDRQYSVSDAFYMAEATLNSHCELQYVSPYHRKR
jgi:ferredoxin